MTPRHGIGEEQAEYPPKLKRYLATAAPRTLSALGNLEVLKLPSLALFSSIRCPGELIARTYDLAQHWRAAGLTVISGFHSPMERECLRILRCSPHPVIVCPARGLPKRVPPEWKCPLAEGRFLVLSAFPDAIRRVTAEQAQDRNRFIAALADEVFVAHAEPGGKSEGLCRQVLAWKKPLYTHVSEANQNLLALGAQAWPARTSPVPPPATFLS